MKHYYRTLILIFIITSLFSSGCSNPLENLLQQSDERSIPTEIVERSPVYIGYQRLDAEEASIYNQFCEMIDDGEESFVFETGDADQMFEVYHVVLADRPEYYWLSGSCSYEVTEWDDHTSVEVFPEVRSIYHDVESGREELEKRAEEIAEAALNEEDLYHTALYIHDTIVDIAMYDEAATEHLKDDSDEGLDAATAYGCLINGKAICSGYSAAFQLVMQKAGIPCERVTGVSKNGEPHQWNDITIGDESYYVDVTWDDPVQNEGEESLSHEFFCITEEEALLSRTIDDDQYLPDCTSTQYEYYHYQGWYLDEYDRSQMQSVIQEQASDGVVTLKFATKDIADQVFEYLIEDENIFDVTGWKSMTYTTGATGQILTLWKE